MQSWAITNKPKAGPYHNLDQLRLLSCTKVCIYDSEGNEIEIPLLYLARKVDDIHIEFPYREIE